MSVLNIKCSIYSYWCCIDNKWKTFSIENDIEDLLLSFISAENDIDTKECVYILVLMMKQDVLQRIPFYHPSNEQQFTFLGGGSSLLVTSSFNRWRVELDTENNLVQILDRIKALKLSWVKIGCLQNWLKNLIKALIEEKFNKSEYDKMMIKVKQQENITENIRSFNELMDIVNVEVKNYFSVTGANEDYDILNTSDNLLDDNLS